MEFVCSCMECHLSTACGPFQSAVLMFGENALVLLRFEVLTASSCDV
jgi:hypothetical protein